MKAVPVNANDAPTRVEPDWPCHAFRRRLPTVSQWMREGPSVRFAAALIFLCVLPHTSRAIAEPFALGTTNLLEGPRAGVDGVVLAVSPTTNAWTAVANNSWLHVDANNIRGVGSTNVQFTFDANFGPARNGSLTVAGVVLTVTQAGGAYVPANLITTLVSSEFNDPRGLAVDGAGNAYIGYIPYNAIEKWTAASGMVTTLVSWGKNGVELQWFPNLQGVAVDGLGNVYFAVDASFYDHAIVKWTAASGTINFLGSLDHATSGVAVDGEGNVYVSDSAYHAIRKWTAARPTFTTLFSDSGAAPSGFAVDGVGNVYFFNRDGRAIKKWTAANGEVTTLISLLLNGPEGVAVDGAGNVYFAAWGSASIVKLGAGGTVETLPSGLSGPEMVAVDKFGNVYVSDPFAGKVNEIPRAFVDPTAKFEPEVAGHDVLPTVLPMAENLSGPFAPTSDQPWLTIAGITNGVVTFGFTANTHEGRTGHLTVLGVATPVVQAGPFTAVLGTNVLSEGAMPGMESLQVTLSPLGDVWSATANAPWLHLDQASQSGTNSQSIGFSYDANPGASRIGTITIAGQLLTVMQKSALDGFRAVGTTNLFEGPGRGKDSVVLGVPSEDFPWTVTVNDAWLHLDAANSGGFGSTNVVFSFDENFGSTRTGALTVDGVTVTVTQAGATYVPANPRTPWVSSGLNGTEGLASDSAGNIYIADSFNNAVKKWTAVTGSVTTLISSGLNHPVCVAVDAAGNVYIANVNSTILKWTASTGTVTTLVDSGLFSPAGVAVDGAGNVYIADTENSAVKKWTAASGTVTTLVDSGLNFPQGVAVDAAGNVYIADTENSAIKQWTAATGKVTTLVSLSSIEYPGVVAVDGKGNVYFTDNETFNSPVIGKWTDANGTVTRVATGESTSGSFNGIAVDGVGQVYFTGVEEPVTVPILGADAFVDLCERAYAFVDPTTRREWAGAGVDALPTVLPNAENLLGPSAPTSDQPWLTITGITNGVVNYAFTTNESGAPRAGHINVLGHDIAIQQLTVSAPGVSNPVLRTDGSFQFGFSGTPGGSYSVLFSTNVTLPLSAWTPAGAVIVTGHGQFQFVVTPSPMMSNGFYRVTSP